MSALFLSRRERAGVSGNLRDLEQPSLHVAQPPPAVIGRRPIRMTRLFSNFSQLDRRRNSPLHPPHPKHNPQYSPATTDDPTHQYDPNHPLRQPAPPHHIQRQLEPQPVPTILVILVHRLRRRKHALHHQHQKINPQRPQQKTVAHRLVCEPVVLLHQSPPDVYRLLSHT